MNCVILQPSYMPWRGYFHQIFLADVFVFYDDVQYDKGGWRNRNRIATPHGPRWLTIPVHASGTYSGLRILDVPIAWDTKPNWAHEHVNSIRHSYARAPFYRDFEERLENLFECHDELLVDFLIRTTTTLSAALGIKSTRFVRSSELRAPGDRTQRLVNIMKLVGADHYISGPSGASYIDATAFEREGFTLEYMDYRYPEYGHLYEPFDGRLSVLDLLMMTGPRAQHFIWSN